MVEDKTPETDRCISCAYRLVQMMADKCPHARFNKRSKVKVCASYINRHLRRIANEEL